MSYFEDAMQNTTLATIRTRIIGWCQSGGLVVTNWLVGAVGQQMFEAVAQTVEDAMSIVPRIVRGYASLDTSTDPGDVDPFDANNASLPPAPGFLSSLGENVHSTTRAGETFAGGFVTFVNNSSTPRSFAPEGVVFTWTVGSPPSPAPTYRNAPDPSIYTNVDGTVTVGVGQTVVLPVVANELGIGSNAPSGSLSLTTTLVGCSATNAAAILATDREPRDVYVTRCRQASARLSFDGPADAYGYFAAKNADGTPLLNADGTAVAITKTYVSQDSATGNVDIYFASASGPALSEDVEAANENIRANAFVVPDAISLGPGVDGEGHPGGVAATGQAFHVAGSVKVRKQRGGPTGSALQEEVKEAIVAALIAAFASDDFNPIGGVDQVSGAGVLYTLDIVAVVKDAHPGVYDVIFTAPTGGFTAIPLGHVATLTSSTSDWVVTVAA